MSAEQLLGFVASAAGSAAIVHGIYQARKSSRLAEIEAKRLEAAATLQAAAEAAAKLEQSRRDAEAALAQVELRKQEVNAEDRSATADLIANMTEAYGQHARTLSAHIASVENRVRDLESIVNDRDTAIRERDNVIRRLRSHVHMANGELFKAGLREFIRQPADIIGEVDGVAPERRVPPVPARDPKPQDAPPLA